MATASFRVHDRACSRMMAGEDAPNRDMLDQPPAHAPALPAGHAIPGQPMAWGGREGRLFGIFFGNLLLGVLTLGIYRFWGIVRIRRYVWTHLAVLGDRLEYAGTGGELFRGFLIVLLLLVPLWLLGIAGEFLRVLHPWLAVAVPVTQFAILLFLLAAGRHAARRYLASRTIWRGIRLVVTGSPWRCARVQFLWFLATLLTLGIARPWGLAAEARWSLGRLNLGTQPFIFTGRARQILRPFLASYILALLSVGAAGVAVAVLWQSDAFDTLRQMGGTPAPAPEQVAIAVGKLAIASLGLLALVSPLLMLAWFSFAAAAMRWRWQNLAFGGARLALSDVTGWSVARLQLGNLFLMWISLGLLYPVVVRRRVEFLTRRLWAERYPDVSPARQAVLGQLNAEGLANILDAGGAGIGL
ncbi:DUF898 domain-containing protein [Roseomonas terrae]|uniref:DUF898 domain-containing protein n=2 Tax=Neoroseomonas terrae TaxID=424799 RepID=A0ABS5EE18_9PROT|nr:DUF898 domain-containing protein [Neoroseomonas terrae]